jgi:hypothetical protein
MVTLRRADVAPLPPNQITVKCPLCLRQFHLIYSDDEWHRVNTLLKLAEGAIREDHKKRHEDVSIELNWNPVRSGS